MIERYHTQNRSTAVMARRVEPHDSLDDFPTPPWATRAFLEWLQANKNSVVTEPCSNRGYMVKVLREYFQNVQAADIKDYGAGFPQHDYLMPFSSGPLKSDWIITNPPFKLALQIVQKAIIDARVGVAVIVRTAWAEGGERHRELFRDNPPQYICQHVNRVPMVKGNYDKDASSATAYAWFVWHKRATHEGTQFIWLDGHPDQYYWPSDEFYCHVGRPVINLVCPFHCVTEKWK